MPLGNDPVTGTDHPDAYLDAMKKRDVTTAKVLLVLTHLSGTVVAFETNLPISFRIGL